MEISRHSLALWYKLLCGVQALIKIGGADTKKLGLLSIVQTGDPLENCTLLATNSFKDQTDRMILKRNAFQSQSFSEWECAVRVWSCISHFYQCNESRGSRFQIKAEGFPNIPSQTMYGNFEYRSLICWGLLPKQARRIKRYPAHFIVEENLFEDLFRIIVHLLLVHLHKKLISR